MDNLELLIAIMIWVFIGWATPFIIDFYKKWKGGID